MLGAAKRGYLANRFGYSARVWERAIGALPWIYPGRPAELDFSVMWLEAGCRGRLLDVGAGSGWLVEQMNALGWEAEGLDFDEKAIARARMRGLVMHAGGLPDAGFGRESFDALTMSHSIEHVNDPMRWIAEAYRVLRPGGALVVATPNARSLLHRKYGEGWFALDPPRHLHLFNRPLLHRLLEQAGFSTIRVFTSIRDANGAWLGSRAIRRLGHFDMMGSHGAAAKGVARLFQVWELATMILDPDAGEDLVAIARR